MGKNCSQRKICIALYTIILSDGIHNPAKKKTAKKKP